MGLSPLCVLLFFSLFPNSGQSIWHTALRLMGTLGTPGRGGASFREETQAGASNKTISVLGALGPDLIYV